MNYNNKQQPYTILGRFQVLDENNKAVDYCRIKFHNTKNVQVVANDLVKLGNFEDNRLVKPLILKAESVSQEAIQEMYEEIKNAPAGIITTVPEFEEIQDGLFVGGVDLANEQLQPPVRIIAINPKGEEIQVDDLEGFCDIHDLDFESVEAVLDGKQKTHRKWRFKTV